jgi:thiamine pyrophosphokinase
LLIKRVVIFANGNLPNPELARAILHSDDFIIAADGGALHSLALGCTPNLVIGDLDSISNETQQKMRQSGVEIVQFSADKNETDLELAIQHAVRLHPNHIVIVAALGNRLDQTLGNISLLTDPTLFAIDIRLDDGVEEGFFCREQAEVRGGSGDIVSLIPWQGDVTGVRTSGLKWPLQSETLYSHKTRGISNEMTGETATVQIESGLLLVVHARNVHK